MANGDDGIAFLGRFCFDYDPEPTSRVGSIEFRVTDPNHDTESGSAVGLWWAMYSDQEDSWPLVRDAGDSMTCFERRKAARVSEEFKFGSSPPFTINYPEVLVEQHLRPRFWFAVLYHCDETTVRPIRDVQYEVHFVNREQSSWDREFGTNERGLNTMYLVLLIVYSLFFVVHFIGVHRLRKQIDYLHPVSRAATTAHTHARASALLHLIALLTRLPWSMPLCSLALCRAEQIVKLFATILCVQVSRLLEAREECRPP